MALQLFSTGDHDNPGFVEKVKQYVFPDLEPSNLEFPHARFIQNGLIAAQTFVDCLRSNNVNFYGVDDMTVSCKVANFTGPNRARIQSVYAFKLDRKCRRVHYEQKGVGAIGCFGNANGCCVASESAADIVFQSVMSGTDFCAQEDLVITENAFLCGERIWAKGACDRIYLASMFPCDYKVAVHWEGIKQHYADTDLITDDEELLDLIALYLEGERALRLDRDMDKHKELMRKPAGRGDWGGVFWQRMMDMKHRCREERRLRPNYLCDAFFDDNALVDACAAEAPGVCAENQYVNADGDCVDCFTPQVTLTASAPTIDEGESVTLSWSSLVPDIDSSVVTVEYGSTVMTVTRNEEGNLTVTPSADTTYTIRAVTVCGTVTATVNVVVTVVPPCVCPEGLPDCLELDIAVPYEVFLGCSLSFDGGGDTLWDGTLPRISDCKWGYEFPNDLYITAGETEPPTNGALAVVAELVSCNPFLYRLTFTIKQDGNEFVAWQGESLGTPFGPFVSLHSGDEVGCTPATDYSLKNCEPCTKPIITFDPPSGSTVNFPSLVFIHADIPGSSIYYGIDEDPIHLYSGGPLSLSAGQVLKALAIGPYPDFCLGDTFTAAYTGDDGLEFAFICDPPQDKAGVFGEFAPNGVDNDYHWRIKLTRGAAWTFRNAKIYETDSTGFWVTGQAWATVNPIYPVELGGAAFSVYPMVVFDTTPAQLNFAYGDPVDSFAAGLTTLHAYGQPFKALVGYFRLEFTLDEGGAPFTIYKLIPHSCEPPPCPPPPTPEVEATCEGALTLSGTLQAGSTYRIYGAQICPPITAPIYVLFEEFIATSPSLLKSYGGLNDCDYAFFISVYCAATDTWINGPEVRVTVPPPCDEPEFFCNNNPIVIPAFGQSNPYPSSVVVTGRPGTVVRVEVQIDGFYHGFPDDVEIMLIGPDGTAVLLMNDCGGGGANQIVPPGVTLVFSDTGAVLPDNGPTITSGTYKPTSYGTALLPSPAPPAPHSTSLADFIGKPCNGTWQLLVNDDHGQDSGKINGWCLHLFLT